jgi:hypothetical protein
VRFEACDDFESLDVCGECDGDCLAEALPDDNMLERFDFCELSCEEDLDECGDLESIDYANRLNKSNQ